MSVNKVNKGKISPLRENSCLMRKRINYWMENLQKSFRIDMKNNINKSKNLLNVNFKMQKVFTSLPKNKNYTPLLNLSKNEKISFYMEIRKQEWLFMLISFIDL